MLPWYQGVLPVRRGDPTARALRQSTRNDDSLSGGCQARRVGEVCALSAHTGVDCPLHATTVAFNGGLWLNLHMSQTEPPPAMKHWQSERMDWPQRGARHFSEQSSVLAEATRLGGTLGVCEHRSDIRQSKGGLNTGREHGRRNAETGVTHYDPMLKWKMVRGLLKDIPDYYTRLSVMECEADRTPEGTQS